MCNIYIELNFFLICKHNYNSFDYWYSTWQELRRSFSYIFVQFPSNLMLPIAQAHATKQTQEETRSKNATLLIAAVTDRSTITTKKAYHHCHGPVSGSCWRNSRSRFLHEFVIGTHRIVICRNVHLQGWRQCALEGDFYFQAASGGAARESEANIGDTTNSRGVDALCKNIGNKIKLWNWLHDCSFPNNENRLWFTYTARHVSRLPVQVVCAVEGEGRGVVRKQQRRLTHVGHLRAGRRRS